MASSSCIDEAMVGEDWRRRVLAGDLWYGALPGARRACIYSSMRLLSEPEGERIGRGRTRWGGACKEDAPVGGRGRVWSEEAEVKCWREVGQVSAQLYKGSVRVCGSCG